MKGAENTEIYRQCGRLFQTGQYSLVSWMKSTWFVSIILLCAIRYLERRLFLSCCLSLQVQQQAL
ncbi:hypothetical protein H5410_055220 [Solanum commersonii]|uniref:Uncharacterized protein n=1 Tax=Solanum commersonii TaxID=4109 RepID=A0A9J5WJP7_SOLCO|nr:hypothetical protein H5410_055220 [Solanum commersonii]